MTPTMLHRGPDDEGYLDSATGRIALGMRRLSIIDLEGGHQPIFNEDGKVGVVLNGEIYNFKELRRQLEDRCHTFLTRSDSEVVAHAYEEWGADCVEYLEGMFALAVYDRREVNTHHDAGEGARDPSDEGSLFLARDRLGIKPLYYAEVSGQRSEVRPRFLFASEVRTLLASDVIPRRLSPSALESYFLFGSVSEPMTLVDGVLSLPPGHRMTLRLGASWESAKPERYWSVSTPAPSKVNGNGKGNVIISPVATVRRLLEESVKKHLIADVPVGVFLSGGIDSTALAALASREVAGVHTFTVAFPEEEFSEAAIARRTAAKLGATHREVMLSGDEMLAQLTEAVGALDQPSMDGINTYFVSMSARRAGLKVALSGLGGDEVFGGYSTFRRTPQYQRLVTFGNRVPGGVRATMAAAAVNAGGRFTPGDAARKIAALWNAPQSFPDPYYFGRMLFTPAQVLEFMNGAKPVEQQSLWRQWLSQSAAEARQLDSFAAISCLEAQSYLVSTLLRDTDSMSMAHSLEVRVPFLDHPLVEFVTQLPQSAKLSKGVPKALLVAALEDVLPLEVRQQAKRGFTFPWATWLRGPLKNRIENGLSELSPTLREALNAEKVRDIWQSYLDGKTSWSRPWSLYVLNEWVKRHL
jgi:asparagine synthase (glutamine-hydrolysing)